MSKIKDEIQAYWLAQHDALGSREDVEDKELFDQQHAEVWRNCDIELQQRKDELKAKTSLLKDEETELSELTKMFPEPSPPSRDLAQEIDELKAKVTELEKKVK